MDWILDKIAHHIAENENQTTEENEIVRYGIEVLILKILFFSVAILIGVIMGKGLYCILFMISFVPMRSLAGGYHADRRWKCAIMSAFMLIVSIGLIYFSVHNSGIGLVVKSAAPAFLIALLLVSPVETDNKPLNSRNRTMIRRKLFIIAAGYAVLAVTGFVMNWTILGYSICVAVFMTFLLVVLGMIHNKRNNLQGAQL